MHCTDLDKTTTLVFDWEECGKVEKKQKLYTE